MDLQHAREQYWQLCNKLRAYRYALNLSSWDISTLAPSKGKVAAAKARGILAGEAYALQVSTDLRWVMSILLDYQSDLTMVELREIEILQEEMARLDKIPRQEYQEYSELQATTQIVWEAAKEQSDFGMLAPYLERLVQFSLRFSKLTKPDMHPYDVLLDEYEKKLTVQKLDDFFGVVRDKTVPLVAKIRNSGCQIRDDFLARDYPVEQQRQLCRTVLQKLGFDFSSGVLATSEHPFTESMVRGDVRLTTHFYRDNLSSALLSSMHEGGHGIYDQKAAISPIVEGSMLDCGSAMSVHESQSRFYENVIGRSRPFWEGFFPEVQAAFPDQLADVTADEFFRAVNVVKPGPIRIVADEVTYNLHILIRYELEKALLEERVSVRNLPRMWNEKYEEYLGITPTSDREGVLQDIHWSGGMFGYFPSYALGNAYAAQLYQTLRQALDFDDLCSKGDIRPITEWLCEHVHQFGNAELPGSIMERVTGESLNPSALTSYLEDKFSSIYFK